jgi:predicted nucleic acid-binding protein
VLYVDSSALVKHYIREQGTDALNAKLNQESARHPDPGIFISDIGFAEMLSAVARRVRMDPKLKKQMQMLQQQFIDDWMFELTRVELTAGVLGFIPRLVTDHALTGADAIHLASALWLRDAVRLTAGFARAGQSLTFASSDSQLNRAALAEGLLVFDPEDKP